MAKRKVKAVDTWKLKKWYDIIVERDWGEKKVGETAADDEKKLIGRRVEVPASYLTGRADHIQYLLYFRIGKVVGGKAYAFFDSYELERSFVKRLTRRHTSKIENVFDVATKDGKKLHVKVFVWTATRASRGQATDIRKIAQRIIEEEAKKRAMNDLVRAFIDGEVPSKIVEECRKILPIRRVEVAKVRVIPTATASQPALAEATA